MAEIIEHRCQLLVLKKARFLKALTFAAVPQKGTHTLQLFIILWPMLQTGFEIMGQVRESMQRTTNRDRIVHEAKWRNWQGAEPMEWWR